jgi:hypothetical protein
MGDRCYMRLECRQKDRARFEALGFVVEVENGPVIEMLDEDANYAHYDQLPEDVPFIAEHGAGGNYGAGMVVCDGQETISVDCGHDNGFVLDWDDEKNRPKERGVRHVQRFVKLERKVRKLFVSLIPK